MLRALAARTLDDARACLDAARERLEDPEVARLRADLAAERARADGLAARCTEREGRLGAAYTNLCEETARADRAEIERKAAREAADRAERTRDAARTQAEQLTEHLYALARRVGAPHATMEHIAHAFDARLTHAQEIANTALAEGLAACEALRAQERDLRALQDRSVRDLRAELSNTRALYNAEADRRVKAEEAFHKLLQAQKHHDPALLAARHYLLEGSASAREDLRATLISAGYPCRAPVVAEAPPKPAT